jgi:hypothetical protein
MCTYDTQRVIINGSAKGANGWFRATNATVYFDHPVHFGAGHALMVDVMNPTLGPSSRVGLELDAASARTLANAILASLDGLPTDLLET